MGQYYKPYLRAKDGTEKVFCSQNAVFMTAHGIEREDGMPTMDECWKMPRDDPRSYYQLFSGLKLMEHSWMENDFVNGVLECIDGNPCVIAWVGDYANEAEDFVGAYTPSVYGAVWGNDSLPEGPFDSMPTVHREGFIVNRSKGLYIDLAEHIKRNSFSPRWDEGRVWCIHPLPLLTAIGNGRGGGDYWGSNPCSGMVGAWAMHCIEFTEERPTDCAEVDYGRIAFAEED